MLKHVQSALWESSARKGVGVSLTLHAGAALLLAGGWLPEWDQSARFSGSQQTITLEATFVEETQAVAVVELPLVQIQPGVAWIAEQRFVDRPSVAADWELPQVPSSQQRLLEQTPPAIEMSRPPEASSALAADSSPAEQLPRTQTTPQPRMSLTAPEPAGMEAKQPPIFFSNPPPRYPELARQRGWEGDVLLRLTIDETGMVTDVTVKRSSGYELLDAAAVRAVRLWRAEPARRFGRAVKTVEYLPVQFRK